MCISFEVCECGHTIPILATLGWRGPAVAVDALSCGINHGPEPEFRSKRRGAVQGCAGLPEHARSEHCHAEVSGPAFRPLTSRFITERQNCPRSYRSPLSE